MTYRLKIDDRVSVVTFHASDCPSEGRLTIDDVPHEVAFRAVAEGHYRLEVDGRVHQAFVSERDEGKLIWVKGRCYLVQDARREISPRHRRRSTAGDSGRVTPPTPAMVVRILVQQGDPVAKGQGLVVLSAMKMETTLVAPFNGVVKKINTAVEAQVMPGDILVDVEEEVPGE